MIAWSDVEVCREVIEQTYATRFRNLDDRHALTVGTLHFDVELLVAYNEDNINCRDLQHSVLRSNGGRKYLGMRQHKL